MLDFLCVYQCLEYWAGSLASFKNALKKKNELMKFNTFDLFELITDVILFNVQITSTLSKGSFFHYGSWVLLTQHQTSLIASLLFIMTR